MRIKDMIKGARQMPGMLKALKNLKKEGGMALCNECLKRQLDKTTDDPEQAMEASINSGLYKKITDQKCFICGNDAKYMVNLKDAMKGMNAHKK